MAGMSRLERAQQARIRAHQMEAQARKLEAEERELARKKDVARKAIIGGAMLGAIRGGNLTREDWERLIWPSIAERDRERLKGWPWHPGEPIQQLDNSKA